MRQLTITQSITNRGTQSLNKYLLEVSKMPLITAEKEIELAQAIRGGDKAALECLTKANLRFVVSVAKQYQFRGLSLSDLINEGNLGLIRAAMRFDETKGFKFISYAVWWIRQSMIQALTEQGRLVRLPANRINLGNKVQRATSQLEQSLERAPSAEELAEELDANVADIMTISAANDHHYISLDAPSSVNDESTMGEKMVDRGSATTDNQVDHNQSLLTEIMRCLETLTEREKMIICHFYGIGNRPSLSVQEIGIQYNMTGERVRQIKDKAISRLKTPQKANLLRSFLG